MADPTVPPEMLAQKPTDTIVQGTRITPANWKQYAEFMPYGLQALFSGNHGFPNVIGPDEGMTVGPENQLPLPKLYIEDTEKYGNQGKLEPVPSLGGGYTLTNYTAGLPFPNPTEPLRGVKIAWNAFYHYQPAWQQ
jgi:hypothetical protein